jgi:hypothetical protein
MWLSGSAIVLIVLTAEANWRLTVTSWLMSAERPVDSGALSAGRKDTFHGLRCGSGRSMRTVPQIKQTPLWKGLSRFKRLFLFIFSGTQVTGSDAKLVSGKLPGVKI